MVDRLDFKLGVVGFGEVGSALGAGLRKEGLSHIVAFDTNWNVEPYGQLIRGRASSAGARLVDSFGALARESDVIFVLVPGISCIDVAQSLKPHMHSRHLYADLAATTPQVKEQVAAVLEGTGAKVADGAIVSSPSEDGHRLQILASGQGAESFQTLLNPWGMRIQVVGSQIGAASGIKSLRSVFTKGAGALILECLIASARYGVQEQVLSSIAEWMDRRPFLETAQFWITSDSVHAERRAHEAHMCAETVERAGLDPMMTQATAARLDWLADLRLREHFGGVVPTRYAQVLEAIETRLKGQQPSAHAPTR